MHLPKYDRSGSDFDDRDELGSKYGCPTFQSTEELLASGIELDGVLVASNHASHAEIGIKAAEAGLHILMEKPMTTDVAEARYVANGHRLLREPR